MSSEASQRGVSTLAIVFPTGRSQALPADAQGGEDDARSADDPGGIIGDEHHRDPDDEQHDDRDQHGRVMLEHRLGQPPRALQQVLPGGHVVRDLEHLRGAFLTGDEAAPQPSPCARRSCATSTLSGRRRRPAAGPTAPIPRASRRRRPGVRRQHRGEVAQPRRQRLHPGWGNSLRQSTGVRVMSASARPSPYPLPSRKSAPVRRRQHLDVEGLDRGVAIGARYPLQGRRRSRRRAHRARRRTSVHHSSVIPPAPGRGRPSRIRRASDPTAPADGRPRRAARGEADRADRSQRSAIRARGDPDPRIGRAAGDALGLLNAASATALTAPCGSSAAVLTDGRPAARRGAAGAPSRRSRSGSQSACAGWYWRWDARRPPGAGPRASPPAA